VGVGVRYRQRAFAERRVRPTPNATSAFVAAIRHLRRREARRRQGAFFSPERKEFDMANPFVHVELHTKDLPKARQFYQSLFGWELKDMPMPGGSGSYTMIGVGEGVGGGMMADTTAPPSWLAYVGVDDVRAKTAQAKSLGATVLQDIMEVGDFGTMSVIRDPTGAPIALWQSKPHG
jgi:uncharacterized protein